MKTAALYAVALVMSLTACGNDSRIIDDVKNRPINDQLTYSQAFEGNTYCRDNKWTIDEDAKRRTLVIHTCKIEIKSENIAAYVDQSFSKLNDHAVVQKAGIGNMYDRVALLDILLKYIDPNGDGYDSNSSYTKARLEELQTKYEVKGYDEGMSLLEEYRTELKHDIDLIPGLYEKFKAQKIADLPNSMELTRTISIALLPNGKDEWYKPEFADIETGAKFLSNGNSITSTTNLEPQQIYNFIISNVYPGSSSTDGFREYLDTLCTDDVCPLLSQFYEVEDI